MKKNRKFVYLISPNKIKNNCFYIDLESIFKTNKVSYFQLRLKKEKKKKIIFIGKKVKKICKKYKVKLIINDSPYLANKIGADGCHLGQSDGNIQSARKKLKSKIIGVTCHNSIKLVNKAARDGVDYIAIGAFYSSKTKKIKFKATIKQLLEAKKITKIPIIAIGGINFSNYKKLLLNKANFLAISGYVWNNNKLNPPDLIRKLK